MIAALAIGGLFALVCLGWAHTANRAKKADDRAQLLELELAHSRTQYTDACKRIGTAEAQVEWFRSRHAHPSMRRVK